MNEPLVMPLPASLQFGAVQEDSYVSFWLQSSLKRVFPQSIPDGSSEISLHCARNVRLSFQACIRNHRAQSIAVECQADAPDGISVQVRRVGLVPQNYLSEDVPLDELDGAAYVPGLVPDPLYPERKAKVSPFANQSFWITAYVTEHTKPGRYAIRIRFVSPSFEGERILTAFVEVHAAVIGKRRHFPVTHWWNPDCIYDWYGVQPFGEECFRLMETYMRNMLEHGCDTIYVPLLNIRAPELVERPPQLLGVSETQPGEYQFDWSRVRRFVRMAKSLGFERFEWTHFWSYGPTGGKSSTPTRVYVEKDSKLVPLFPDDLDGSGDTYRSYLRSFLPKLKRFLLEEDILERSLFHISDEPKQIDSYRETRDILKELAPWMKCIDAIYRNALAAVELVDEVIPDARSADAFLEKGIPHWVYYCIIPRGRYINRLFDTNLMKVRIQGLLFYKLRTLGFLHWGYNYWYRYCEGQKLVDPFTDGAAGQRKLPYGDPFVVYPGEDGPIDSIRWEVFAEAMQDYALLQTLGISPDDELLEPLRNYSEFPRSESWLDGVIQSLLGQS